MPLETLVKNWYEARKELFAAYRDSDKWLAEKGKGKEVAEPLHSFVSDALKKLSNAEWALYEHVRDNDV